VSLHAYRIFDIPAADGGRMVFIDRVTIKGVSREKATARVEFDFSGKGSPRVCDSRFDELHSTREKALAALAALLDSLPLSPSPPPPAAELEHSHQCTKKEPAAAAVL
jgi:hypothetical protein